MDRVAGGLRNADLHARAVESQCPDRLLDQIFQKTKRLGAASKCREQGGFFVVLSVAVAREHVDLKASARSEALRRHPRIKPELGGEGRIGALKHSEETLAG